MAQGLRARGRGNEGEERAGLDREIEIAKDLGALPIAQTGIGEFDHSGDVSESAGAMIAAGLPARWTRERHALAP